MDCQRVGAQSPDSPGDALRALRTVHVVDLRVGLTRKRGVMGGSARARQVLAALTIADREPPGGASRAIRHLLTNRRSSVMIFAALQNQMSNMG